MSDHKKEKDLTPPIPDQDPGAEDDGFTPAERMIAEEMGKTVEEVHAYTSKDRMLAATQSLMAVAKRAILMEDPPDPMGVLEYLTEEYSLNEREQFTFMATMKHAFDMSQAGFGGLSLIAMFQAGVEFNKQPMPEYTDEDHALWLRKVADAEAEAKNQNERDALMDDDLPTAG